VTGRVGRPRTFDPSLVPLALERRDRTREPWAEIARDLGTNPGTLRNRCAEYLRNVHKIPTGTLMDIGTAPASSYGSDQPPAGFVHPPEGESNGSSEPSLSEAVHQ
jgi:hypothetical protein